jgi:hypothetical protein
MNSVEERAVIKMVLSSKKLNSLHVCNSKTLGIGNKSFEIRRDHIEGPIVAVVLRDVLTLAESKQLLTIKKCHCNHSSWWSKGCKADPRPTSERIVTQLSCPRKMKLSGFASSNVKKILQVGPLRQDGSGRNIFRYESNKRQIITRTLSTSLFRHKWKKDGLNSLASVASRLDSSSSVVDKVADLYCVWSNKYLSSKGFTKEYVEFIKSSTRQSLMLSTLIIADKNPIAVHRDRPTPMPACAFGHSTYEFNEDNNAWEKRWKGGELYLMNGLFRLDYGPRDVVMWDGNLSHGITTVLRDQGSDEPSRFSVLLFSNIRRELGMKTPGSYVPVEGHYMTTRSKSIV